MKIPTMAEEKSAIERTQLLRDFINFDFDEIKYHSTAISLFSGGGISDLGYRLAGFEFIVHAELDSRRAALGHRNFPDSEWVIGDISKNHEKIVSSYEARSKGRSLDLLVATPPCQGMSSSNPARGKRDSDRAKLLEAKNRLMLEIVPIALRLRPRVIVAENVPQIRTLPLSNTEKPETLMDVFKSRLGSSYKVFDGTINVADYGIPQSRRRAIIVAIRTDQSWLDTFDSSQKSPWPSPTHAQTPKNNSFSWITISEWLESMKYEALDARSSEKAKGKHPLHWVPCYSVERYRLISDIPPNSGRSAYQNSICPSCGYDSVPLELATCNSCGCEMSNRPIIKEEGNFRLVKGFHSSYRRMAPNQPSATITTASNHIGSDFKIHPSENRLMSILETADLQTIPRFYDWSLLLNPTEEIQRAKKPLINILREVIGEGFPTYFTYIHGNYLANFLA